MSAPDAFERYLRALGIEPADDPEMAETARRFSDLLTDWFVPGRAPSTLTAIPTQPGEDDLVIVRDVAFRSLCAHHILPFFGSISIAFEPDQTLVGFGGLSRLVDSLCRRPQLQERLVAEIADRLVTELAPKGVLVVCRARQMCMEFNGTPAGTETITTASRGTLAGRAGRELTLRLT